MAGNYKKGIAVPVPRSNPLGTPPRIGRAFPKLSQPRNIQPLKTRMYAKSALQEDPMKISSGGFGATGLQETPSILGMGKTGL